ncbi:MAG: GTPase domain-containing protein [Deferrisomatales bacterium]|nr:GTPase domain-containing protein [Deferrisomatales bacterium]
MSFVNLARSEIQVKIVYYGPGRCGKTTNLAHLHEAMAEAVRGKMIKIDTQGDRTLFFDFLPLALGKIHKMNIRIQLYTVPGQIMYTTTRKLVLRGVDGVVFVADSRAEQWEQNLESLEDLRKNLAQEQMDLAQLPLVFQYNKRDLDREGVPLIPLEELDRGLNRDLRAGAFPASALQGDGVFETLREISKRTVKHVTRKLLGR